MCGVQDEVPDFCQVVAIFQTPAEECLFVMRQLATVSFYRHYHAFEVTSTSIIIVKRHFQFRDHHPLYISTSSDTNHTKFICMKYHIVWYAMIVTSDDHYSY